MKRRRATTKLVHEPLAELEEDREAGVDGSIEHELGRQQVDDGHRLGLLEGAQLWSRAVLANRFLVAQQIDVRAFSKVFHGLPKHGVVEQLEKVL